ncbi:hypothetical protein [Vibrio coralliilyticus]|uniref:hypothetical protein n=1 Tax=Vibrio coralliilyticus TaxID=190893 RepID=UPI0017F980A7|nr:hypothetical protein [Vibrio coralliilyticus]NUW70676.1 hypothetical protein [Vibrio coralliilyticus]
MTLDNSQNRTPDPTDPKVPVVNIKNVSSKGGSASTSKSLGSVFRKFLCVSSNRQSDESYALPISTGESPLHKNRLLSVKDLTVDNNDMKFGSRLKNASGALSMVYTATHKPSNEKYIVKQISRGGHMSYLEAKKEVFAYALSEKLSLGLVPHTAHLEQNSRTIRVGNNKIEDYNLPGGRGNEYVMSKAIISGDNQELIKAYNRKKSPLYVFDYILGQSDRSDTASNGEASVHNVIFDKDGNINAIDHSIIFHPNDMTLTPDVVRIFLSNPDTVDTLKNTDWNAFFDEHIKGVVEHEVQYTVNDFQNDKAKFLHRVREVQRMIP